MEHQIRAYTLSGLCVVCRRRGHRYERCLELLVYSDRLPPTVECPLCTAPVSRNLLAAHLRRCLVIYQYQVRVLRASRTYENQITRDDEICMSGFDGLRATRDSHVFRIIRCEQRSCHREDTRVDGRKIQGTGGQPPLH